MTPTGILAAIAVLAVVIMVHEWGHFIVARKCNTEVQVFSFGFGPKLFAIQRGETEYRFSLIPLGGYVRMAGEIDEFAPKVAGRGFPDRPLYQRAMIVVAGPAINMVFAFFLFTVIMMTWGNQVTSDKALVGGVVADSPAQAAGLAAGDLVTAIDGQSLGNWDGLHGAVTASEGREIQLSVLSEQGEERVLTVTPESRVRRDYLGEEIGTAWVIGVHRASERQDVGPVVVRLWRGAALRHGRTAAQSTGVVAGGGSGPGVPMPAVHARGDALRALLRRHRGARHALRQVSGLERPPRAPELARAAPA